jgi:hypothetical protein
MILPVRVMSGNGCHLWLAVPPISVEQAGCDELTERLKAFEAKVHGLVTPDTPLQAGFTRPGALEEPVLKQGQAEHEDPDH